MYLQSDSAAGVRFMAAMAEGRGVKPSARAAGVGKETGFRWLRERFLASRALGVSVADAQAELGYFSARVVEWDRDRAIGVPVRHHLAVPVDVEAEFWGSPDTSVGG
jgi:IS30 family transposase